MTSSGRRSEASSKVASLGLDELALLGPAAPPPASADPRELVLVRAELELPEDVLHRAKALVRPARTGARRSLSSSLMLQAYVRAVDALELTIDTRGLRRASDDEAVERVLGALRAWAGSPDA